MRSLLCAASLLALTLSGCKVDAPPAIGGVEKLDMLLATTTVRCRDPRGRFAKCQTCPDGSKIWVGATCPPPPPPAPCPAGTQLSSAGHCEPIPAPAPQPVPAPTPTSIDLATEGDSISAEWSGNYVGIYRAAHPSLAIKSFAVGGSGMSQLEARLPNVLAEKPKRVSVLIGANETPDQAFHDRLMVYVGKVRASGAEVFVGTLLPQQDAGSAFSLARPGENSRIRNDAAAKGYKVIDFAADSAFATWSAALFGDYVHPNDAGQKRLAVTYTAALDGVAPVPSTGWEPSPSLAGLTPIASNFDIATGLQAASIPGSAKPDVVGAFRFICNAGQLLRDDPIVFPNQPGKSHLHQFYGNTAANAASTYKSLRETGASTCGKPLNRSAYWMPAMLDGLGNVVRPDFVSIYYKRRPKTDPIVSDPANPQYQGKAVNLPNGLKFIFGYDMLTGKAPTGFMHFACQGLGAGTGSYRNLVEAEANCPVGAQLGAVIEAPDCWDGKNLDSPNHRDHVAYASYGDWGYFKCPSTHPYVIPTFTLGAWYTKTAGQWRLSSDEMMPTLPRGTTFHADFWMAWDDTVHGMWEDNCLDKLLNCSAGILGNGKQIIDAWVRTDPAPKVVPIP